MKNRPVPLFDRTAPNKNAYLIQVLGWFLAIWTIVLSLWLYLYSVRHGGVPCWDGFERCAWGAHIWRDIQHLDFYHLWVHTNAQVVWPPLHSWLIGLSFSFFGPSLAAARVISLLAFFASGIMIFCLFLRRRDSYSWVGGVIAWALFATAPIVIQQAVGIMSEGVGLFFTLLVLFSLPQNDDAKASRWVWSGLILGAFFLYKYNYAFLTYAGILAARYFQAKCSLRRMIRMNNLLLFGLPVLMMVLWFLVDSQTKWDNLMYFVVNNTAVHHPWGFSTLFYYPQVIPDAFFAIPWMSVICLALVFIVLPFGRKLNLSSPVTACCLVHFAAVALHPMKIERFQFITMGLFFIMTGEAVVVLCALFLKRWNRILTQIVYVGVVCLLALCVNYQTSKYRQPQLHQQNVYIAPLLAVADRLTDADSMAMFITHEQDCPPAATFYLMTGKDILQRDVIKNKSNWNHLFLLQPHEPVLALSVEERLRHLNYQLYLNKSNKIVIIESTEPSSVAIFPTVFAGIQEYIKLIPQLEKYHQVFDRTFPQAKARVRILELITQ